MEAELRAAVERITDRNVVAFMGTDRCQPDVAATIFLLDAPPLKAARRTSTVGRPSATRGAAPTTVAVAER